MSTPLNLPEIDVLLSDREKFMDFGVTHVDAELLCIYWSELQKNYKLGLNFSLFVTYNYYQGPSDSMLPVLDFFDGRALGYRNVTMHNSKIWFLGRIVEIDGDEDFDHDINNLLPTKFFNLLNITLTSKQVLNYDEAYRIDFTFDPNIYTIYKIPPLTISQTTPNLYMAYQSKIRTDFTLISETGTKFKVHALILLSYGGQFFESFFAQTQSFIEHETHTLPLKYSDSSISNYIDFIYGKPDIFKDLENVDLIEMYVLASFVMNQNLIDTILNIINWSSDESDLEGLNQLYKMYPNGYLHDIIASI